MISASTASMVSRFHRCSKSLHDCVLPRDAAGLSRTTRFAFVEMRLACHALYIAMIASVTRARSSLRCGCLWQQPHQLESIFQRKRFRLTLRTKRKEGGRRKKQKPKVGHKSTRTKSERNTDKIRVTFIETNVDPSGFQNAFR